MSEPMSEKLGSESPSSSFDNDLIENMKKQATKS